MRAGPPGVNRGDMQRSRVPRVWYVPEADGEISEEAVLLLCALPEVEPDAFKTR